MNAEPIKCNMIPTFYDDTINVDAITIGYGFRGFIRKIKVYDWPKNEESMELMYRVAPACYKFHHTQGNCDICDIDYNFTCYTDCAERNMWDYDCKS
jgi:hypothetical protein